VSGGTTKFLPLIKAAVDRKYQPEVMKLLNEYVLRSELDQAVVEVDVPHDTLAEITTDNHHNKSHAHDGADGSGIVDHTDLTTIGTNTHAQIDTHIADLTIHFTRSSVVEKSSNYTIGNNEEMVACDASGGAFTVTMPSVTGKEGYEYIIKKTDSSSNYVTISGTIDGDSSFDLEAQDESVVLKCNGTDWWII
jgi:hypothetical protein